MIWVVMAVLAMCSDLDGRRPGIPNGLVVTDHDDVVFLGGTITPSGKTSPENAYILNLQGNGYIDGLALETCDDGRRLWSDRALGHLINHHPCPNVYVTPFCWSDVDVGNSSRSSGNDDKFWLPNVVRADGTPRCLVGDDLMVYDNTAGQIFGAAIQASEDLVAGQELFMDYGLTEPYPAWAKGWYNSQ
jgi:hypothetical protein